MHNTFLPKTMYSGVFSNRDTSVNRYLGNNNRDTLITVTSDNLTAIAEGFDVWESYYPMTFGTSVDRKSDVRRLLISGAMVTITA